MNPCNMSRRKFIQSATLAAGALATASCKSMMDSATSWPIGCFNRPWMQKFGTKTQPISVPQIANWGFDVALRGIQEAGYPTVGLLTPMPDEPFIGSSATMEYLSGLKKRIAAAGLRSHMGSLRVNLDLELRDAIKDMRLQIDHAQFLGLGWLLTFGTDKKEHYEKYYKMMSDAADYALSARMKLVMKPHGGSSATADEIRRCIRKVNRPNFKIWYDAGNIVYYDGKDPVEELKPIVEYVTGFCAKDCDHQRGSVMIQFGTGKVDFVGVFKVLKAGGFNGPIYVECAGGKTYEEVTAGARENRLYLEKIFSEI